MGTWSARLIVVADSLAGRKAESFVLALGAALGLCLCFVAE